MDEKQDKNRDATDDRSIYSIVQRFNLELKKTFSSSLHRRLDITDGGRPLTNRRDTGIQVPAALVVTIYCCPIVCLGGSPPYPAKVFQ